MLEKTFDLHIYVHLPSHLSGPPCSTDGEAEPLRMNVFPTVPQRVDGSWELRPGPSGSWPSALYATLCGGNLGCLFCYFHAPMPSTDVYLECSLLYVRIFFSLLAAQKCVWRL